MVNDREKWIDSYENSFNYLLNIVGHIDKKMKKINDSRIKTFNTLIGSYCHFKKDILLFEQHTNVTYSKNGTLVDSLNWGVEVVVDKTTNKPKTVVTTEPKAVKTGSTNYVYAIAAGVVVIAGITLVVARKKNSIA